MRVSTKIELTAGMVREGDSLHAGQNVYWDVESVVKFPHLNSVRINLVHGSMAMFMVNDVVEVLRDDPRTH